MFGSKWGYVQSWCERRVEQEELFGIQNIDCQTMMLYKLWNQYSDACIRNSVATPMAHRAKNLVVLSLIPGHSSLSNSILSSYIYVWATCPASLHSTSSSSGAQYGSVGNGAAYKAAIVSAVVSCFTALTHFLAHNTIVTWILLWSYGSSTEGGNEVHRTLFVGQLLIISLQFCCLWN